MIRNPDSVRGLVKELAQHGVDVTVHPGTTLFGAALKSLTSESATTIITLLLESRQAQAA
ncbi:MULTISPECIES: hypothetical protein [Pandoraea]|uniref:Uncharacterized protein n=2 Tax=Pandoraea TaxID=93217 RepID=A0A5E4XJ96_9BURK|nr:MULTISPECIES: hypothetical protein [Pandoraea]VVE18534.1 hypothetical protein PCE31107_03026 [Pandoraea cepalis]VVE36376.1 hypothetical protein PTE31013_03947 [Pandoraea terrigena]